MAVALTTPFSILYCSNEIFKYERNVIGKGKSFVFPGFYVGKEVAVKRIVLTSLTEDEFQHQKKLNHENVVELLAVFDNLDFRFMVLELCSGTLLQVIQKTYIGPPLPSDRDVMYQIADGLAYVHSQNLVHFDIKLDNILISTKAQMKLADFGLSKETINGFCNLTGPTRGTLSWMAPEVFGKGGENSVVTVSPMADIFSCGCVFFVFISRENGGIHPFGNCWKSPETTQCNIRDGEPVNIKNLEHLPGANLILPMIENEQENRGSLEQVKNNLRDPASSSSIPSNMNTNTSHQAQQAQYEEPNTSFESHKMMEETNNQQTVPNKLEVELIFPQSPSSSINGFSLNNRMEVNQKTNADKAGNVDKVKIGTSNKSNGEDSREMVGNDFGHEVPSALSGCNSLPSTNGSDKPKPGLN